MGQGGEGSEARRQIIVNPGRPAQGQLRVFERTALRPFDTRLRALPITDYALPDTGPTLKAARS